ncbi:hypothetical protein FB451DRAFT_1491190 [Mycena latifolia]|nr:hypothetical protein FB451DRAFT_1491190 [Mycena latifolia]
MVNRRVSSDLKERAIELGQTDWDPEDIRYAFQVSPRSLYHWRAIFEELGTVTKPPSPLRGRDHIVTLTALTAAKDVYFKDSSTMLDIGIHHDIVISKSALQATLERAARR